MDTTGEDEVTLLNLKGSSAVHTPYLMRVMIERNRCIDTGMRRPEKTCRMMLSRECANDDGC